MDVLGVRFGGPKGPFGPGGPSWRKEKELAPGSSGNGVYTSRASRRSVPAFATHRPKETDKLIKMDPGMMWLEVTRPELSEEAHARELAATTKSRKRELQLWNSDDLAADEVAKFAKRAAQ